MKAINGTFLFKTKEQLLNTGWRLQSGDLCYSANMPVIPSDMADSFCGKYIQIKNSKAYTTNDFWYISLEMIYSEEDIVTKILTKYEV